MAYGIGIDTGGTYTDAVVYDFDTGRVLAKGKSPTTRNDLAVGIGKALDMLPIERVEKLETGRADYDTDEVFEMAATVGLVREYDGPFDCYICDDEELQRYSKTRRKNEQAHDARL